MVAVIVKDAAALAPGGARAPVFPAADAAAAEAAPAMAAPAAAAAAPALVAGA